jgi:hypothetical protein
VIEPDPRDLKGEGHRLLATRFGTLDILSVIEKGRGFEELLSQTVAIEFRGHRFYVFSLEIIVELKRGSKDPEGSVSSPNSGRNVTSDV